MGSDAADVIQLLYPALDEFTTRLVINDVTYDYPRSDLVSAQVDAGAGSDRVEFAGDVTVRGVITGGDGDDTLLAGAADDVVDGGLGNDSISGGDGADVLSGVEGLDTIDAGAGDDLIDGGADDDSLAGAAGLDTIWGDTGADTIWGGDDDDLLSGGLPEGYPTDLIDGNDVILAGAGNDTAFGAAGDDAIDGEAGNDELAGGVGFDSLVGGAGFDVLVGGDDADTLAGGADEDRLDGGAGADWLDGGLDYDSLVIAGSDVADSILAVASVTGEMLLSVGGETDSAVAAELIDVRAGLGDDLVDVDPLLDVDADIDGGDGSDTLYGGHGDDLITGGPGSDSIDGRGGDDMALFHGTELDDTITGTVTSTGAAQVVFGLEIDAASGVEELFVNSGDGNDAVTFSYDAGAPDVSVWFEGHDGDDTLLGGPYADFIWAGGGIDSVNGGGGDDIILGASGDDCLEGGAGNDLIDGASGDDVIGGGLGHDTLKGFEGYDTISGADGDDVLDGGGQDDSLDGGMGNDTMSGSDGFDTLVGESGDDSIEGGAGDDSIDAGDGLDSVVGGDGDDTIGGQAGDDSIYGGLGNDRITGGDGDDTLGSDEGDDVFYGGNGNDRISGGADSDQLFGGEGSDVLDGGAGDDRLIGGERGVPRRQRRGCDNDSLAGAAGDDTLDGGRGRDLIDPGADVNDVTADPDRDTIVEGVGQIRLTRIRKSDARCDERGGGGARGRSARPGTRFEPGGPTRRRRDEGPEQFRPPHPDDLPAAVPTGVRSHNASHETANLAASITASATSVPSRQQLGYTAPVTNAGPKRARKVTFFQTLAPDVALLSVRARDAQSRNVECPVSVGNDVTCEFGAVPAGGNAAAAIDVAVDNLGGTVDTSAMVYSNTDDPDKKDNTTSNSTTVTVALEGVTISASAQRPVAYEADPSKKAEFQVCRYEARSTPLTVNFQATQASRSPASSADHQSLGSSVVIDAVDSQGNGGRCGSIWVTATNDGINEGPEYVRVTLTGGAGYTFDANRPTAEVGIADDEVLRPTVKITATDATAAEWGDTGKFTITRTTAWSSALTVVLNVTGTATQPPGANADVQQAVETSVVIPANASGPTIVEITVRPVQEPAGGGVHEDDETVVVNIVDQAPYQVGGSGTATVTILDDDPDPGLDTLRITATDAVASETRVNLPLDTGTFLIERGNTDSDVMVNYTVRQEYWYDATPNQDYTLEPSQVTIERGELSQPITVRPIDDSQGLEQSESVVVTLNPVSGVYNVAAAPANSATVTIYDNDCRQDVSVRRVTHSGDRRGIVAGTRVTLTAALSPRTTSLTSDRYSWWFAELLSVSGGKRHHGPWQPAVGTMSGNTFTTTVDRSGQYLVTLAACGNPSGAVTVEVTPRVSSVQWVSYRSPLLSNNHPNPVAAVGLKMYPDKNTPRQPEPERQRWVDIEATVVPARAGIPVYFTIVDVDDPSYNGSPLDPNGLRGNDNIAGAVFPGDATNNYRNTCAAGLGNACRLTDAQGVARATISVSMQPGDNFRAAATTGPEGRLRMLQVDNPGAGNYVGPNDNAVGGEFDTQGAVSRMLTVWRRLWIEVDSMAAPPPLAFPVQKGRPDHNTAVGNDWQLGIPEQGQMTLNLRDTLSVPNNFYKGGRIKSRVGDVELKVLSNTATTIVVEQGNIQEGDPNLAHFLAPHVFWVLDDDELIAMSGYSPLLSRYNLINDQVKEKYKPAYITLIDVNMDVGTLNPRREVPFQLNITAWPFVDTYNSITVDDARDLPDQEDFWSHLVVAGYQPEPTADRDPDGEVETFGETPRYTPVSVVYLETIRDYVQGYAGDSSQRFANALHGVVAHEIAHPPGGKSSDEDHGEGGLMEAGVDTINHVFRNETLRRFRQAKTWFPK